ncbi:MAG: hypothetical protein ABJP82_15240 [Hyphomicrobiales bacterium]
MSTSSLMHSGHPVWHATEADYPLIVVSNETHSGMVETHDISRRSG